MSLWQWHFLTEMREKLYEEIQLSLFLGIKWNLRVCLFDLGVWVLLLFSKRAKGQDTHSFETILTVQWAASTCTHWGFPLLGWNTCTLNWMPELPGAMSRSRPRRVSWPSRRKGTRAKCKAKGLAASRGVVMSHRKAVHKGGCRHWSSKQIHGQQSHHHDHLHRLLHLSFSLQFVFFVTYWDLSTELSWLFSHNAALKFSFFANWLVFISLSYED